MTSKSPPDPELTERLRSLVGRLVVDLRIGEGRGAEGLATASVAMLGKMISPYDVTKVATTQTQRTLTERAPDPAAFRRAYEALKATGAREVDKYLAVVAKIASDPDVLAAVTRAPGESAAVTTGGDSFPTTFGTSSGGDATMDDDDDDGYGVPSPNLEMSARAESAGRSVETTSLGPLGNFSFNTNPLASETDADAAPLTPGASVGMRTMTQSRSAADDDRPEGPVDPDVGSARLRSLHLIPLTPTPPTPAPPRTPTIAEDIRARIAGERPPLREGVDFPALPAWMSTRPYLTGAHLGGFSETSSRAGSKTKSDANADPVAGKPLDAYTTACQELLVLDDLLYAMLGAEGRYVRARRVDAATGEPVEGSSHTSIASSAAEYIGSGRFHRHSNSREPLKLAGTAVRFAVEPGLELSLAALVDNILSPGWSSGLSTSGSAGVSRTLRAWTCSWRTCSRCARTRRRWRITSRPEGIGSRAAYARTRSPRRCRSSSATGVPRWCSSSTSATSGACRFRARGSTCSPRLARCRSWRESLDERLNSGGRLF